MTPAIAAVLVNYNAGDELRAALQSIAEAIGRTPWEAVVVDNATVMAARPANTSFIVSAFPF